MHPQLLLIGNLKKLEELTTNDNKNIFISYFKYTNITPPAYNRGRWYVDGTRFLTNS